MDRYFFHINYGEHSHDAEGTLCSSLDQARSMAVRVMGELLRDEADKFWAKPTISITVTDSRGLTLWSVEAMGIQAPSVSLPAG